MRRDQDTAQEHLSRYGCMIKDLEARTELMPFAGGPNRSSAWHTAGAVRRTSAWRTAGAVRRRMQN